jgi:hypothetical protein
MISALLLAAAQASAQTAPPPTTSTVPYTPKLSEQDAKEKERMAKDPDGWNNKLTVGSNISLSNSTNVVGRPDGTSVSLGATVDGRFALKEGLNRWVNVLALQVQQTRTPLVDAWVKSLDLFKVDSTYFRDFASAPWVSFYAGLSLESALFGGEDVRPLPTNFRLKEVEGPDRLFTATRFLTTKEFSPTTLQGGTGASFRLLDRPIAKLAAKAGLSGLATFTRNGITITDNAATPEVELTRMRDYQQMGANIRLDATGNLSAWATYTFFADLFFPFVNSFTPKDAQGNELSYANQISVDLSLKLGFKMAKWASLDYVLGVRRIPLTADVLQIWNGLFVSFAFSVVEERKPPEEPKK